MATSDATKASADDGGSEPCTHPELRDGEPVFEDACVNVEHTCVKCGKAVAVTSWTREGWDEDEEKKRRAEARTSRRLPRVHIRRQG
jgi:hypothetical protein